MVDREEAQGTVVLRDGDGELRCLLGVPAIFSTELRGRLSARLMEATMQELARHLRAGGHVGIFHDWFGLTTYEPAARSIGTRFVLDHRHDITELHVGVHLSSKLILMAIEASNLLLGGFMHVHGTREPFEAALWAATARAKR